MTDSTPPQPRCPLPECPMVERRSSAAGIHDLSTRVAVLEVQVDGLHHAVTDMRSEQGHLRDEVRESRRELQTGLGAVSDTFNTYVAEESQRQRAMLIGVIGTLITAMGGLLILVFQYFIRA